MKKFNLLVVSDNAASGEQYLNILGKLGRRNFVFEVESLDEAETLLKRLNVDMILVDLDRFRINLDDVVSKFEGLLAIGTCRQIGHQSVPIHSDRIKIIRKDELLSGLAAEFKVLKKEKYPLAAWFSMGNRAEQRSDFKNFGQLLVPAT